MLTFGEYTNDYCYATVLNLSRGQQ